MTVHSTIADVTARIEERSRASRAHYLERIRAAGEAGPKRGTLSCGNLAHGFAACGLTDKERLAGDVVPNLGIITAYNDMLSAHQPFERFPELIREAAREAGGVAQVAGGVPAMCDGVTQGQTGMELSLFRATSSPWRPPSACRTRCSTPPSISAFATRSFRA